MKKHGFLQIHSILLYGIPWLLLILLVGTPAYASGDLQNFLEALTRRVEVAEQAGTTTIRGRDGWLFFVPELRHLSVGPFWGEAALKVSRASKPEYTDPLPAILDFKAQLDRAGIELLFVPVPAKAAIYPDKLPIDVPPPPERIDAGDAAFVQLLAKRGISVLDLTPYFQEHREESEERLYCRQDTHWSGRACALTAELIANRIRKRPWWEKIPKRSYVTEDREVEIRGDLWQALGDESLPKERLPLSFVRTSEGQSVTPWRESPVLLLGDSHTLVFHGGGDMHASGAGLADHLAYQLGFPVDLVGVRGSGATPSRISLARRRDNLKGKRFVIWCLSVREFTEGQGWRKVPVVR